MATPNRNQHWVPQFYLRYFATSDSRETGKPQIWALPVDEGDEFLTNPRNIAAQRDLYAFCASSVDERLTDLEGLLARFWPRFANDHYPIDDTFRKALSLFIATLYLRHPAELERHRLGAQVWAKIIDDSPKDEHGRTRIRSVQFDNRTFEITADKLEKMASLNENVVCDSWGDTILKVAGALAKHLLTLPWTMLFTSWPAFITSDHPVCVEHDGKSRSFIMTPGAVIRFPLSTTRLLVIGDPRLKDGEICSVIKGGDGLLNYLIFRSAYKHVFSAWDPIHVCRQVCEIGDRFRREEERKAMRRVFRSANMRIGRNAPCPCGSGRKLKKCCGL